MAVELNPFPTENYISKRYFCDRKNEIETIVRKLENGSNLTLISNRRMGKTALIYRIFEELNAAKHIGIFVDIFSCTDLKSFTETLALAIFNRFPEKRTIGRRFMDLLRGDCCKFTTFETASCLNKNKQNACSGIDISEKFEKLKSFRNFASPKNTQKLKVFGNVEHG